MKKASIAAIGVSLAWTTYSLGAEAQQDLQASVLYEHGLDAKDRGDYLTCIGDMDASYRVVPKLRTLYFRAKCEELAGKIASADGHYRQLLEGIESLHDYKRNKYADLRTDAEEARERLYPSIPTLTLILPVWAPKNVEIARDGIVLPSAVIGLSIPVDPGEHMVTTQVPGGLVEAHRFIVKRNDATVIKLRVDVPPRLDPTKPSTSPSNDELLRSLRKPGYVTLGVGGAGLLTWAIAGSIMIYEKSTIEAYCARHDCPLEATSPDLNTLLQSDERGMAAANIASVGLGLGLTGAVLGTAMLVGSSERFRRSVAQSVVQVEVGSDRINFGIRGTF